MRRGGWLVSWWRGEFSSFFFLGAVVAARWSFWEREGRNTEWHRDLLYKADL